MSHFKLISSNDIHNGPVDYSTPIGECRTFRCSRTVKAAIEARKPKTKKFMSDHSRDNYWMRKFEEHTTNYPDYIHFAKNGAGIWYVRAVFL